MVTNGVLQICYVLSNPRNIEIIQNDGNTVVKIVRDVMNFMYLEEQKIGVKTVNGYSI